MDDSPPHRRAPSLRGIVVDTLSLVVPRVCPCGDDGGAFPCPACTTALAGPAVRVESECASLNVLTDADAAAGTVEFAPLFPVLALGEHRGALRRLVLSYKDGGMLCLAGALAPALRRALEDLDVPAGTVLVPVPSSTAGRLRRGEDHTRLLATHIARGTGLRVAPSPALAGPGQTGRDRRGRRDRADPSRIRVRAGLRGAPRAVLVDDVVTTGATLRAVAEALAARGCDPVGALVIAAARLPRDPTTAPISVPGIL